MTKTIETMSVLRLRGAPVTSSVLIVIAKGIVQANGSSILLENGGHLSLNNDWERKCLYRMDNLGRKMTRQIATTERIHVAPALLSETKFEFRRKIRKMQAWINSQNELIVNFDQTRCHTCLRETALSMEKEPNLSHCKAKAKRSK